MKNRESLIPKYPVCYSDVDADGSAYTIQGSLTSIDPENVLTACDTWKTQNDSLSDDVLTPLNTSFSSLDDFIGSYLTMLKENITEILNFSLSMCDAVKGYANAQLKKDQIILGENNVIKPPTNLNYGGNSNTGGDNADDNAGDGKIPSGDNSIDHDDDGDDTDADDNNGDDDGTADDGSDRPPTDEPVLPPDIATPDSPLPGDSPLPDLSGLDLNLNDVTGVVETLVEFAQDTDLWIDEALADSQLAQQLLSAMLSSSSIPEELQSILEEAGSETSQVVLGQLLHGDAYAELFDLNPFNLAVVRSYLEKVASEHGITFEELISNPEYVDILRENLSGFMEASNVLLTWESLSAEEYQAKMLQIFDGDEVGDLSPAALKIIRDYIDVLAGEVGIDAEEMLTDTRYADCLKNGMGSFGRTASFMGVHSYFSNEGITSDIGGIFMGEKPNVFGISDARWYHTGLQLMQYAEEHNISYPDFMIDPKYADQVKEILLASDYTDDLSVLFKNTDSTTVQTMARRVYSFLDYHGTPETEAQAEMEAPLSGVVLWMHK